MSVKTLKSNAKRVHVFFPTKTLKSLDALRGDVSRSLFIRRLIEKENRNRKTEVAN